MAPPVWFITGCSSGIGEAIAREALARGELVIATARAPLDRLSSLKEAGCTIMELDVSKDDEEVNRVVQRAIKVHGRIDVVVPNAGYFEGAFVEECTTEKFNKQLNVNFFGVTKVVKSLLPHFRHRRSGTIGFIGSVWATASNFSCAMYGVSKHAVSAYAKTLALEMGQFNVRPILFELGFFKTLVLDNANRVYPTHEDYRSVTDRMCTYFSTMGEYSPGDPGLCAKAIVDTVHDPNRKSMFAPLGSDALATIRNYATALLAACDENEEKAKSTDFPGPRKGFFKDVPQYWRIT